MAAQAKTRAGIAKRGGGRRRNGLFSSLLGSKSTSSKPLSVHGKSKTYKGHRIDKLTSGEFEVPSIERGSYFDNLKDAKRFIDQWRSNPIPAAMLTAIQSQLGSRLTSEGLKRVGKAYKANPGKGAFQRCVAAVTTKGGAADPKAVCAAQAMRTPKGKRELLKAAAKGRKKHARRSNPGRKNPEDAAAARYESFHGREPEEVIEVTRTIHEHSVTSGIGKLIELKIRAVDRKHDVTLGFSNVYLTQDEKGKQLFIDGPGSQKVNLGDFGITNPHEIEVLGEGLNVVYDTRKDHLGKDGGKAFYTHPFGKNKDGKPTRKPVIVYDVRNQLISFAGGDYTLPDVGIDG